MEEDTKTNTPKSKDDLESNSEENNENEQFNDTESTVSRELVNESLDSLRATPKTPEMPNSFSLATTFSYINDNQTQASPHSMGASIPLLLIGKPPIIIKSPVTSQPRLSPSVHYNNNLNQPQSLFLQALSKINESSLSIVLLNHLNNSIQNRDASILEQFNKSSNNEEKIPELSPPDSLTSAPPSYSFVLRQMAARRRPRFMGTFIPSPSFIQHPPPPNYAEAFDIYVDNAITAPPARVYNFGFTPMPVVCPECGYTGMSTIHSKITICTHLCAIVLCLLFCWICAPLPYVLRSCKDVYHYCRNCRNYLGMYCPTNTENSYPS